MSDIVPPRPPKGAPPPLPVVPLNYRGGAAGIEGGAWRFKKILFAHHQTILPERCVKCNSSDGVKMKQQKFTWASPMLYLLILVNLLVAAIVIACVQKKATITYGLCATHRRKRLNVVWITLAILGAGILCIVLAILMQHPVYLLGTLAGILGSLIYWAIAWPVLRPQKIDKEQLAELKGRGEPFLATLPNSQWE